MPSEDSHIGRAEKNERFFTSLNALDDSTEHFPDWEIVGLFYSALHYVDAYLARQLSKHPNSHEDRIKSMAMIMELRAVSRDFFNLYDRSRDARYNLIPFTRLNVQRLRDQRYEPLKRHIRAILALS